MKSRPVTTFIILLLVALIGAEGAFARKAKKKSSRKKRPAISVVYTSPDGNEWIHKGKKGIYIVKDSLGQVRAMQDFTGTAAAGRRYSEIISEYALLLAHDSIRVYSLVAPTQGEFYLPQPVSTQGAEKATIQTMYGYLDPKVTPVMVCDTLRAHVNEEIYNRTDHHWSPLGAYYAAKVFAEKAGVFFRPLSDYTIGEVKDYVGTMYKFSGDAAVKNSPETFVYYMPPTGYRAEFITYTVSGGKTVGESEPEVRNFFRHFDDGAGAAYSTFMGGDSFTVKVSETGGTPGRKLLIVKDSYGNAMAPMLFGSFEEVHVADFRYFPHGLIEYVRTNGITDLLFINTIQLAIAPNTADRLKIMLGKETDELDIDDPDSEEDESDEDEQ